MAPGYFQASGATHLQILPVTMNQHSLQLLTRQMLMEVVCITILFLTLVGKPNNSNVIFIIRFVTVNLEDEPHSKLPDTIKFRIKNN